MQIARDQIIKNHHRHYDDNNKSVLCHFNFL